MTVQPRPTRSASFDRTGRRVVLFSAPIATALVVLLHPPDPTTAGSLGTQTDLYIAIHVGLLFMLPLLAIAVWLILDGLTGTAAGLARLTLPFMLVFYAAFDALVGIGAGLMAREALAFDGPAADGAQALAARWMEIPMPIPILGALGPLSWTLALGAAAVAHFRAGSHLLVVLGLAVAAPLFGFGHAFITGPIAMAGLVLAAAALEFGRRPRLATMATDNG